MKLTLNLNLEEVNLILRALGKQPFEEVYELIGIINDQANQQLKQTPPSSFGDSADYRKEADNIEPQDSIDIE